jgi:hypothetical protein
MNAIEQEIMTRFRQLDSESRKRLLASLTEETDVHTPSLSAALQAATTFRTTITKKYGKKSFGIQDMLDEIR